MAKAKSGFADAKVGDIYVDKEGRQWRVAEYFGEPSVHMIAVAETLRAGISSLAGFRRIHRDPFFIEWSSDDE